MIFLKINPILKSKIKACLVEQQIKINDFISKIKVQLARWNESIVLDNNYIKLANKQQMLDQFRTTGKFKQYTEEPTTSSIIKIPQQPAFTRISRIYWSRRCGQIQEKLFHYNDHIEYECTELDKDCIIQVNVEIEAHMGSIQTKFYRYGPIQIQPEFAFLLDNLQSENQMFDVQIITNRKNYQCLLNISGTEIVLKNKNILANNLPPISLHEISKSYIQKLNNELVLTFPSIFVRVIVLKLFNELVSEGNYSENNDPTLLKVLEPNQIDQKNNKNGMKNKDKLKWRRFLLKINYMKEGRIRRMSSPQVMQHSSSSQNIISYNIHQNNVKVPIKQTQSARQSQYNRYSIASNANTQGRSKGSIVMKKSQNFQRSMNTKKKSAIQAPDNEPANDNDRNYMREIQDLIYDGEEEPKQEELKLEESFQMLQKKSKSQKQQKLAQQVKAKKKLRDGQNKVKQLKSVLQQILSKRKQLLASVEREKNQIEQLQQQRKINLVNNHNPINYLKMEMSQLRFEYQKLVQEKNGRREEERRSMIN